MSENILKAKSQLIVTQPFFASILMAMPLIEDNTVKTFSTDGDDIRYNAEFLKTLTPSETIFVLAHETLHCVFEHALNRGSRNAGKWNVAADYVINNLLVNDKVGIMPNGGLFNPSLVAEGETTEGVYKLLPDSDNDKKPGDKNGPLDQVVDSAGDEATRNQKSEEMKVKVIQAANAAKMSGKLSAGLSRLVKEVVAPKVDWKSVLRRFLTERAKVDLSYAKPKRRFLAEDIYLPSLTGEKMGSVVIAIDASGSIYNSLLELFGSEVKSIISDIMPSLTHIMFFDSEVLKVDSFGPDDTITISPVGGGGTRFSPIFEYISSHELNPVACVVLTDLECSDFGDAPEYPVLWASIQNGQAPFGEIVRIKE